MRDVGDKVCLQGFGLGESLGHGVEARIYLLYVAYVAFTFELYAEVAFGDLTHRGRNGHERLDERGIQNYCDYNAEYDAGYEHAETYRHAERHMKSVIEYADDKICHHDSQHGAYRGG